jgi:hypothetical protein
MTDRLTPGQWIYRTLEGDRLGAELEARAEKAEAEVVKLTQQTNTMASTYITGLGEATARAEKAEAEVARLREALRDMLSGWRYIRSVHGDLYGVGWDRCENSAMAALAPVEAKPRPFEKLSAELLKGGDDGR